MFWCDVIHTESSQLYVIMESESNSTSTLGRKNNDACDDNVSDRMDCEDVHATSQREVTTCNFDCRKTSAHNLLLKDVIPKSDCNSSFLGFDDNPCNQESEEMAPVDSALDEDADHEMFLGSEIKVEINDEDIENFLFNGTASKQSTGNVIQNQVPCTFSVKLKPKKVANNCSTSYQCSICGKPYVGKLSKHLRECHSELLLFHCNDCGMGFMVKSTYEKHVKIPHPNNLYKCGRCKATFKKQTSLKEHMASEHNGRVPAKMKSTVNIFKCEICEKSYNSRISLFRHLTGVHKSIFYRSSLKKSCLCKYCGKFFENAFDHEVHKKEHKNPPFKCSICKSVYKSKGYLKNHVRMHLTGKPTCNICGVAFVERKTLRRHMLTHTLEMKFLCEFCGEGFPLQRKFKTHMRKHTKEPIRKPFNCPVCEKPFRDRSNLACHMQKHRKTKDFVCNVCGKALGDKRTLKNHLGRHQGKTQFKCPICEKSFAYVSYRTAHMRSHTKEKPFKCEQCGNCFTQKSSLNTHKKIHNDKKQHVCSICNKAFLFAHYLKVHMRSHTGERPFKCANCNKAFTQKCTLNVHLQNCM